MLSTIEATHNKFSVKINNIIAAVETLHGKLRNSTTESFLEEANQLNTDYSLATVSVLSEYYRNGDENTNDEYYKKVTRENFISRIRDIIFKTNCFVELNVKSIDRGTRMAIMDQLAAANNNNIELGTRKINHEMCKCGSGMVYVPESSERRCLSAVCGRVKIIQGSAREDNNFADNQKSKCNGYDFGRHLKFWLERLQAQEHKNFDESVIGDIRACLSRDRVNPTDLTCTKMRAYLKETSHTIYNDHVPLLVVTFGGRAPPKYNFQEVRDITIKFNKIIAYYHKINPNGSNRPYYPYFIYKIVEQKFSDSPEKLRLLDYIHLQSDDTIKKNDGYYEEICKIAMPEDNLVYKPTNVCRR